LILRWVKDISWTNKRCTQNTIVVQVDAISLPKSAAMKCMHKEK